jgi:hypothetical protein
LGGEVRAEGEGCEVSDERRKGHSALRVVNGNIEKFDPHDAKREALEEARAYIERADHGKPPTIQHRDIIRIIDAALAAPASQPAPAQREGSDR